MTKKTVSQLPSLQLVHIPVYSNPFAVWAAANDNLLAYSPCRPADSDVPMLHH